MDNEQLMRDLIIERLKGRFSGQYREITFNEGGSPDLILANHGMTLVVVQVETESSITPERAKKWGEMAQSGSKLILMVPKNARVKAMELLWKSGIADRVGLGSYDISIQMP